jgi:hypothetical protein
MVVHHWTPPNLKWLLLVGPRFPGKDTWSQAVVGVLRLEKQFGCGHFPYQGGDTFTGFPRTSSL